MLILDSLIYYPDPVFFYSSATDTKKLRFLFVFVKNTIYATLFKPFFIFRSMNKLHIVNYFILKCDERIHL